MTDRNPIPAGAVLVAVDIAKLRNEVLIEIPAQKRRRSLSVLNNRAEHDRFIETLMAYGAPIICAFEATGNYHTSAAPTKAATRKLLDKLEPSTHGPH